MLRHSKLTRLALSLVTTLTPVFITSAHGFESNQLVQAAEVWSGGRSLDGRISWSVPPSFRMATNLLSDELLKARDSSSDRVIGIKKAVGVSVSDYIKELEKLSDIRLLKHRSLDVQGRNWSIWEAFHISRGAHQAWVAVHSGPHNEQYALYITGGASRDENQKTLLLLLPTVKIEERLSSSSSEPPSLIEALDFKRSTVAIPESKGAVPKNPPVVKNTPSAQSSPSPHRSHFDYAIEAAEKGDYAKALAIARQIITQSPDYSKAQEKLMLWQKMLNEDTTEYDTDSEAPQRIDIMPYAMDRVLFAINYEHPGYEEDYEAYNKDKIGYYEIINAPFGLIPFESKCADFERNVIRQIIQDFTRFREALKDIFWTRTGCSDLNQDGYPELALLGVQSELWGKSVSSPFLYSAHDSVYQGNLLPSLRVPDVHKLMLRQNDSQGSTWPDLWAIRHASAKRLFLYPLSFTDENRYKLSKLYYKDAEVIYSSKNKKLEYKEFNSSAAEHLYSNRTGTLLAYEHVEGQAYTGFLSRSIAIIDLKTNRRQELQIWEKPEYKQEMKKREPKAFALMQKPQGEFDFVEQSILGFNGRNVILKSMYLYGGEDPPHSKQYFTGYWSYNIDTKKVSLLSWKPNASISVEHTGFEVKIVAGN